MNLRRWGLLVSFAVATLPVGVAHAADNELSEKPVDDDIERSRRRPRTRPVAVLAVVAFLLVLGGWRAHAATIAVTTTSDEINSNGNCSLREAIQAANGNVSIDACLAGSGADTITLPAGTYILGIAGAGEDSNATGDLDIGGILTINGASALATIIDGAFVDRVFHVLNGTVTISGVTIKNGSPPVAPIFGGGIFNQGSALTVTNSTISGNSVGNGFGGAIATTFGSLTVINSTLSGNSSGVVGGGISNGNGALTLTNSTVSGNSAGNEGGGIFSGNGGMTLTNSTVSGNSATTGGGIRASVSATLKNTIVANSPSGGNCSAVITSGGHNLSSDATCAFGSSGDLNNTDPLLGPLADNAPGTTQTHALLAGSPAIDAGDDIGCPDADQRGLARPQGAACDIGAYEVTPDHFTCYKAGASKGSVKFPGIPIPPGVDLLDQFGSSTVEVKKSKFLCAPTDKNNEHPGAELHTEHLEGYRISNPSTLGLPTDITVIDQFNPGGIQVDAKKQSHLLVPTAKSLTDPPPLVVFTIDHFQCYKVRTSTFVPVLGLTIEDQFGEMTVDVTKPKFLCNPVDKEGEGIFYPDTHLMCYQVKQVASEPKFSKVVGIFVNNQFGPEQLDVKKPSELCVPALKTL